MLMKKNQSSEIPQEEDYQGPYFANDDMAKISPETVATLAAIMSRPEIPSCQSVIKAYEILELATGGQAFLNKTLQPFFGIYRPAKGWVGDGIQYVVDGPENDSEPSPHDHAFFDDDQNLLPTPFEYALKAIIPKAGKTSNRLPLFRQWLMAKHKLTLGEAGDKIAEWKKTGIPFGDFTTAFYSYPKWRIYKTKEERRKAAAKSRKNKGKQGRVKTKDDKRTKPRPPYDEMQKMLGR